jgi:hypothetical protein
VRLFISQEDENSVQEPEEPSFIRPADMSRLHDLRANVANRQKTK